MAVNSIKTSKSQWGSELWKHLNNELSLVGYSDVLYSDVGYSNGDPEFRP